MSHSYRQRRADSLSGVNSVRDWDQHYKPIYQRLELELQQQKLASGEEGQYPNHKTDKNISLLNVSHLKNSITSPRVVRQSIGNDIKLTDPEFPSERVIHFLFWKVSYSSPFFSKLILKFLSLKEAWQHCHTSVHLARPISQDSKN